MRRLKLWIPVLALSAFATAAHAQVAEFAFDAGDSRLTNEILGNDGAGNNYTLQNGFRFGFRVTLNNWRYFGHEFGYAYSRTHLNYAGQDMGGMAIHEGFYDFLGYATPEGTRVRPFAAAGVHFANFVPPGSSATYGQGSTKFGVNFGGGLKYRVTHSVGIRFDVRDYLTGKPFNLPGASGMLHQLEVSAGVGLFL